MRPLKLWRSWGPSVFVYFVPVQLLQLAVIFSWALWEASPDLAEINGRRKEE